MNIIRYELGTEQELLDKIRQVRLKGTINGVERPYVYQHAQLRLVEKMRVDPFLVPPQRYVLTPTVDAILDLHRTFEKLGVDIFALHGALYFWLSGSDPEKDPPIPLLPPMVEESDEPDGRTVFLINDGMHRTFSARKIGSPIHVVLAQDVPTEYPYYALAIKGGWETIVEFDELPDVFQKKEYRNPNNYKALFRDFNELFAGVQAQRKQSNPLHIKE